MSCAVAELVGEGLLVAFHREGEGAGSSLGDEIADLVTKERRGEFVRKDCAEGAWFISTTVRLKSSDSGVECLEEEGLAQSIG